MRALVLSLPLLLPSVALAQAFQRVIVASHDPTSPAQRLTVLSEVRLPGGTIAALGRFPSDGQPPGAIAWDPIRREVVLALLQRQSSSIVRLKIDAAGVLAERAVGSVPGRITSLTVAWEGDLYAVTDGPQGGVWRQARLGGALARLRPLPQASSIDSWSGSIYAVVANGREAASGTEPGFQMIDLSSGALVTGPFRFPGFQAGAITGHVDLATGLQRDLLSDDLGRVSLSLNWQAPVVLAITPALPPGGTCALHAGGLLAPLVLGGSVHPFLKTFDPLGAMPQPWQVLAGPLPADPVDFCLVPPPVAGTENFGRPCGPASARSFAPYAPALGNARFTLSLSGARSSHPTALLLGTSDEWYQGSALPLALTLQCALLVSADVIVPAVSGVGGGLDLVLPIPPDPTLAGSTVFTQWAQPGSPLVMSDALAAHIE